MAGGTWTLQNKSRPGAYVNFKAIPNLENVSAARGIVAMPLTLNWGPEAQIVEIYSTDLADGGIKKKLGYDANNSALLQVRECLKNCYKLLAYRVNTGGDEATATLGNLTATAKYPGTRGNDIKVAIESKTSTFDVIVYLDNTVVDKQNVAAITDLVNNDYVVFSGSGDLAPSAATALAGGTNGTSSAGNYTAFFELLKTQEWQVLGLPLDDDDIAAEAVEAIRAMREDLGKKVQAVVYDYAADYEGIISTKQGYISETDTVSAVDFVAYAAGISAGVDLPNPNTYREIEGAINIVNPMTSAEVEAALAAGFMAISRRTDGVIVIEQDINTLTSFTADKPKEFRKNRLIRTLDEIANMVTRLFENRFIGKVNNDTTGRELFKQAVTKEISALQDASAIEGFSSDDVSVSKGTDDDSVIVALSIQPVDAMEKLYMTVEVN